MQLLFYQAPMSCLILLFLIPFESSIFDIMQLFNMLDMLQWVIFLVSGLAAFTVNLTTFWIIRNTSGTNFTIFSDKMRINFLVITYATFGKLKLCTTILIGFKLFGDPLHIYQVTQ